MYFTMRSLAFMEHGSSRQRLAYRVLEYLRVFERLKQYRPVVAGTIPLDVDIHGSDLDIVCHCNSLCEFERAVLKYFSAEREFQLWKHPIHGQQSLVATLTVAELPVELFGQTIPVEQQMAFRHLIVEDHLLRLGGTNARKSIRQLKQLGLKTEPAFAAHFGIVGDPYSELYEMSLLSEYDLLNSIGGSSSAVGIPDPLSHALPEGDDPRGGSGFKSGRRLPSGFTS